MLDFKDVDKSDFECWQIEGGSVYYGQVCYVDQDNKIVEDLEEVKRFTEEQLKEEPPHEGEEEEKIPKYRKVRHGLGIN